MARYLCNIFRWDEIPLWATQRKTIYRKSSARSRISCSIHASAAQIGWIPTCWTDDIHQLVQELKRAVHFWNLQRKDIQRSFIGRSIVPSEIYGSEWHSTTSWNGKVHWVFKSTWRASLQNGCQSEQTAHYVMMTMAKSLSFSDILKIFWVLSSLRLVVRPRTYLHRIKVNSLGAWWLRKWHVSLFFGVTWIWIYRICSKLKNVPSSSCGSAAHNLRYLRGSSLSLYAQFFY